MTRWRFGLISILVVGAAAFVVQSWAAFQATDHVSRTFESASQTSVQERQLAATVAVKDAALEQVRQNGIRNGILAIGILLLLYNGVVGTMGLRRSLKIQPRARGDASDARDTESVTLSVP